MSLFTEATHCFLCRSTKLQRVIPLRPIPISTPVMSIPSHMRDHPALYDGVPLNLNLCLMCGQVQVSHIPNFEFEYRNYAYRTSLSLNLREHFRDYSRQVLERHSFRPASLAIEIGSNDGTLSRFFQDAGLHVLGIDPALQIAQAARTAGVDTISEFFTATLAQEIRAARGPAALVCANFVIANIEDMIGFADGVRILMADDAILVIETQYGRDVIERNLLDTIYHEHVSYFTLTPLVAHFERYGIEVIEVERVPTKGGSIRLTAQRSDGPHHVGVSVRELLAEEERIGVATPKFFERLPAWIEEIRHDLHSLTSAEHNRGGTVAGWGVSVGTSALLPQFGLTRDIAFLLDDDTDKDAFLRGPDYAIPVLAADALYDRMPGIVVVFAWRYIDPIMKKHASYLDRGGRFVVPLPHVSVVESATAASPNYISL